MSLKGKEIFVAEKLKDYFSNGFKNISYREGDDPPDIYLQFDMKEIPVEITELDENSVNNRKTVDFGYLKFIDNLDEEIGSLVPNDKRIFISFYHFNNKVSKINKKFKKYIKNLLSNRVEINDEFEDCLGDVCFKVKILKSNNGCRKILGTTTPFGMIHEKSRDINAVSEYLSEFHLNEKNRNILHERILDKNNKCKHIEKPIWLALYDNFFNKFCDFSDDEHIKHYKNLASDVDDYGIFEKVFVVFQNGNVLEIT